MSVPTKKSLADKIVPHIYFALRDLGVIFDKYILSSSPILAVVYHSGTAYLFYGTKNEQ